jgi:hypothetical protein
MMMLLFLLNGIFKCGDKEVVTAGWRMIGEPAGEETPAGLFLLW